MPRTKQPAIEDLIDEAGAIEKEIAPIKPKIDRLKHLREQIRDLAPADKSQVEGKQFVAVLGEPANKTVVDYKELLRRISPVKFAKFATATIAALEANVAAGHLAHCMRYEQTGPRSLKFTEKGETA